MLSSTSQNFPIKSTQPLIPSNNTENRLDLLIEAINFLEMYHSSSKFL